MKYLPDINTIVNLAVIISGIATAFSAIFLRKQNRLLTPRIKISILNNPLIWSKKEKVKIRVCNSSSFPVILVKLILINTLNEKTGELHEYALEFLGEENGTYLRPTEIYEYEIDTTRLPLNIPLRFQIEYKSAMDEFKTNRYLVDDSTRTVIN